jgi:hypothetical protein
MSYPCRIAVLALVLGVALLATSCRPSNSGSGVEPTGAAIGSGPPPLPESSPPPLPTLVPITPAAGQRERKAQWRLAGKSDDGRRLLVDVAIGGPPCDTVTGVDVAETETSVTVTVYAGRLRSADCPNGTAGSLATARVEAKLTRPLADRKLLGGAT